LGCLCAKENQKQAVENCIEDSVKLFAADKARKLRLDAEIERQRQQAVERNERLCQYIRTNDVNMHQTDKPAINNIVLKDLSTSEFDKFFDVVVKSFKREDSVLPR
jgi:hypothetical protein